MPYQKEWLTLHAMRNPGPSLVCLGFIACGCGAPGEPAPSDGTDAGDRTDGLPPLDEIFIAVEPRTQGGFTSLIELVEAAGGPRAELESSFTFALGEGYPREFTVDLAQPGWGLPCALGVSRVSLTQLTGDTAVVAAALSRERAIAIQIRDAGRARFEGEGTVTLESDACEYPEGTVIPLRLSFSVVVAQPTGARIRSSCAAGPLIVAPSVGESEVSFGNWLEPQLVDAAGNDYRVDNATYDAQVAVRLSGSFDAEHATPSRLAAWITPSRPGSVTITPAGGEPREVEVVGPERVTGVEVQFQIAGTASGPIVIENGGMYGEMGWGRAANRLAPMAQRVTTDAGPLCSAPAAAWFELESQTPSVCTIVELGAAGDDGSYTLFGDQLGQAARLNADGECALTLRGPASSPAAGLPVGLQATFLNTDRLQR